MYSIVLMAAVTSGTAAPDHWFRHGCHSCHGCSGCHGSGYWFHGNLCHGCFGGYGCSACYGCYGAFGAGCYGCSCYGCYGGWGGYTGYSYYAPMGCYGCYGCYGGWSCYGTPLPGHGHLPEPGSGEGKESSKEPDKREETPLPLEKKTSVENDRARVIVELPEDAKLYIDGQLMKTPSARRVFRTPVLDASKTYFYELKAEVVRDGSTRQETQRIVLRPGQVVSAAFPNLGTTATATTRNER